MKKRFVAQNNGTLYAFLCASLPGVSLHSVKTQCARGEVRVNGDKAKTDIPLCTGDRVEIFLPDRFAPPAVPVVYEDENIVVADKPPRVDSEVALPALLRPRCGVLHPVHRLDVNTTGLVILAKSERIKQAFVTAFAAGEVKKTYLARVFGCPVADKGRWESYLYKDAAKAICTVYDAPHAGAKKIVTEYEVIERGAISLLALHPVTGRTHQLRAHAAHNGVPIVGDDKYGDRARNKAEGAKMQALRATQIDLGQLPPPVAYLSGKRFCANGISLA